MFHKVVIASLLFVTSATAHDAPLGWRYGVECCSTIDCWQEKDGAIKETPNGYRVIATGELIPYRDARIKRSKDQFFHRCTTTGAPSIDHSICLYVPDRDF